MTHKDPRISIAISRWLKGLFPAVLIAVAFAHNMHGSWLKWGDPVVDGGREMMMPLRMLEGELLYKDQRNAYGPLAPYLNAHLYRIFGVHLGVLQCAGILSVLVMTIVIYLLARRFLVRVPSTAIAIAFLYVFGFAHLTPNPSFNFVLPYAYAATYGMIAATSGLLFLVRYAQDERDRDLALSIIGLVLAAHSKLETLLPVAAAHVVFLAAALSLRRIRRRHVLLYVAGAVAFVVPYALIVARVGSLLWTDNLAVLVNRGIRFYAFETMGFDDPWNSLLLLAISTVILALVTGGGYAAGVLLRRDRPGPVRWILVALPAFFGFVVYMTLGTEIPLRMLPALAIAVLAALIVRFKIRPELRSEILPAMLLWVFTAGCLARLGLKSVPYHYGFFLVPVPFVALGVFLFRDLPSWAGPVSWPRLAVKGSGIGIVAGFTFSAYVISTAFYAQHAMEVNTPRGHMILRGEPWQKEVISFLGKYPADTRVEIIPQGAGLLFLAGVRMAGGLYFYAPMEFSGRYTDEEVNRRLETFPPNLIVLLTQEPGSFRYTGFGIEFGWQTADWVRRNYLPIAGNREVTILRHRGRSDASLPPLGLQ